MTTAIRCLPRRDRRPFGLIAALFLALLSPPVGAATGDRLPGHDLAVRVDMDAQRLTGVDRIRLNPGGRRMLQLHLAPRAREIAVRLNGEPRNVDFRQGLAVLSLPPQLQRTDLTVEIAYTARFDDPFPERPANADNPGFGVTGHLSAAGGFLLAGAGWYPRIDHQAAPVRLTVDAPLGMVAVTAGKWLGMQEQKGRILSHWQVDRPIEGLSLSIGAFRVRQRRVGAVDAMTFFTDRTDDLSEGYLDAVEDALNRYSRWFGPYPFAKFAVVENFFPTGFGFPSYTVMGTRVLRLPFIRLTSLPHEVAHCWWGNGVQVDPSEGNWSEGLATYVADYRFREIGGAAAARDYRRQALRNYAALVPADAPMALAAFSHRTSPATKAVGYDKGAMVFHMLRREIGDPHFRSSLRRLFKERCFMPTAWSDIRKVFEAETGHSLGWFFSQWIRRPDAPRLRLAAADRRPDGGRWQAAARIEQQRPAYRLTLPVVLVTASGRVERTIAIDDTSTELTFRGVDRPLRLQIDPDYHVLRRMAGRELPPTINTLKSASWVSLTFQPASVAPAAGPAVERLLRGLGLQTTAGRDCPADDPDGACAGIAVGRDAAARHASLWNKAARLDAAGVTIDNRRFPLNRYAFFGVFRNPDNPAAVLAVYLPGSRPDPLGIGKATHYGRYSYLVLDGSAVIAKGTWPADASPVTEIWETP